MLKKIILVVLIVILMIVIYIGVLWLMSLDSIMDKDGMVYIPSELPEENEIVQNTMNTYIINR